MTAPLRRSGQTVAHIEKSCEHKSRYSDEFAARASGTRQMKFVKAQLYIYPCGLCRGWHLTKRVQLPLWSANFYEEKKK